ncbi:SDR family oxidoreductase [Alloscardovia criceti]|uniref:SDR family oxidoreductase n=1 Tax=Alloscardovia criceti TaxID=356828 RepID=UPI000371B1AE|nr:SDR family oxidoreductase [Alloscardovia criceti]
MKVLVVGATGRVARFLIQSLLEKGHSVTAAARNPEKIKPFEDTSRLSTVQLDLHDSVEDLAQTLKGYEAVYFVAGSRGKDLLQTDAFGAVKLMQASENMGIKRFLLLSSMFATNPEKWSDPALQGIMNYNIAKFFADEWLIHNTQLDYTIVQPGSLVEAEQGTGKIEIDPAVSQPNSIPNVAEVLAQALEEPRTIGTIIRMSDGQTPISQALAAL